MLRYSAVSVKFSPTAGWCMINLDGVDFHDKVFADSRGRGPRSGRAGGGTEGGRAGADEEKEEKEKAKLRCSLAFVG